MHGYGFSSSCTSVSSRLGDLESTRGWPAEITICSFQVQDLATDPSEHMERVCRFLGVAYQDEMATSRCLVIHLYDETRARAGYFTKKRSMPGEVASAH